MKKEEKSSMLENPNFHVVETVSSISVGGGGPDGCVLDWSKTEN